MSDDITLEISGMWLRQLIKAQKVLTGNYVIPSALRLQAIADRLNTLRALVALEDSGARDHDDLTAIAQRALEVLEDVLPKLKEQSAEWLSRCEALDLKIEDFEALRLLASNHRSLGKIIEAVAEAKENFLLRPAFSGLSKVDCLNDFAVEIADAFRDAVQASNTSLQRLGNSNSGPVARFLIAVAPHVTGETPKAEAIARFLRRAADEDKPN